ncbi:MAG: protein kinase, partial [Myxococcota bacterium]
NVMLGDFGEVYLLDWGVAVELDDPEQVAPKQLVGTPAYMAPEMFKQGTLSIRSDIYLLGGCLHELLCGRPPHAGETLEELAERAGELSLRFPRHVSEGIADIARRALAPQPEDRFESAEALRQSVATYLDHRDSERVAQEALGRLDELVAAATERHPDAVAKRMGLSQAFGACRFGFAEALRTWPDNETAKKGRLRAYETLVRYEAEEGDPKAAAALKAEMAQYGAVPKRLTQVVLEASRRLEQEELRVARLEQLGRVFDPNTNLRARWVMGTALAVLGVVIPAATQAFVDPSSDAYATAFVHPGLFLVGTVVFSWMERASLAATAYNRWFLSVVMAGLCGQLLLLTGGALMSLPVVSTTAFIALLWSVLAGVIAGAVERRLAPAVLVFLAVFFAIALGADNRVHANALLLAGFLVTALILFVVWRPAR